MNETFNERYSYVEFLLHTTCIFLLRGKKVVASLLITH